MSIFLNLAAAAAGIQTLGPGRRIVLWTQGCRQRCPGCISPEYQELRPANLIRIKELAAMLVRNYSDHAGVTISGGEPMLQAEGLNGLWRQVKKRNPHWNLIIFSGYHKEYLLYRGNPWQIRLLKNSDAFIGGPYQKEMFISSGLRGSSNQEIYFPPGTGFDRAQQNKILCQPHEQQLYLTDDTVLLVGLPDNDSA